MNSGMASGDRSRISLDMFNEGDLLHALVDNMPDFIYIKDRSSKFILANQKLANTHGLKSGKEMIGKSDHDYYPKELADKYYSNEQEIIKSGESLIGIEETTLDEGGHEIYLSTTKIPIRDNSGKVIGIVGIGRDISARKKAEQALQEHAGQLQLVNTLLEEKQEEIQQQAEELAAQAENLSLANLEYQKLSIAVSETYDVVVIMDSEGNFEWANKSLERLYGLTLDQYKKKFGNNITAGSMNPHIEEIMATCRTTKKTAHYHTKTTNKEGELLWVQSTLTPVLDEENNITRFIAIDADITALKKAEDLINQQKTDLEIHGRELEKANITKDKFFSIIAHDLKNPFHSIMGFTDLMSKNYNDIDDGKKLDYLKLIHESSRQAYDLLENLLNWSRTQTDSIKYNPVRIELNSLVEEIYRMFHSNIEKKKIRFKNLIPENTFAWADPNMIQTVIRNLVGNAIKFTPDNGCIEISSEASDEKTIISVRDDGIGIPEDEQKKLFSFGEFYTTSGTGGEQGTGLGLLICHEFVKKNQGKLGLTSESGKGSTFFFDIPSKK